MNGSHGNNNYIIHLSGLPWNTTENEVEKFLQGCKIHQVNFTTTNAGRATGECFVVLESQEDVDIAKNFHKTNLGSRYIDVLESNSDEMAQMTQNNNNNNNNNNNSNSNANSDNENNSSNTHDDNWHEPVVRLRGLPYNSSKEDVTQFFRGLDIAQNGVHISSSKPAGEAFVAFVNMDNALRALEYNRMNMGHRYIEVFKATYAEARASIMNDTQSMARQRGGGGSGGPNQNYGSQRQGQHSGSGGGGGGNGGYNNQYNGPPQNNYNSYGGGGGGNNYNTNNQTNSGGSGGGGGVKRPMSVSFTMKIRGVPFEAGEKEVFEFFSPVVPIRLEQENTPRGKPPIWYAEFGSREEATEALTYHKKYMGTRYIELLPLYDDINRSKMVRT